MRSQRYRAGIAQPGTDAPVFRRPRFARAWSDRTTPVATGPSRLHRPVRAGSCRPRRHALRRGSTQANDPTAGFYFERFAPQPVVGGRDFQLRLDRARQTVTVTPDESVLGAVQSTARGRLLLLAEVLRTMRCASAVGAGGTPRTFELPSRSRLDADLRRPGHGRPPHRRPSNDPARAAERIRARTRPGIIHGLRFAEAVRLGIAAATAALAAPGSSPGHPELIARLYERISGDRATDIPQARRLQEMRVTDGSKGCCGSRRVRAMDVAQPIMAFQSRRSPQRPPLISRYRVRSASDTPTRS